MDWPLMEMLGTQVSRLPLTNLQRELHLCRLPNEPPFFFLPTLSCAWHKGVPSFLAEEGSRDVIVATEGTRLRTCQEARATREQYPPQTLSATLCF